MPYQIPSKMQSLMPYDPGLCTCTVRLDANESFITPPDWLQEKIRAALAAVHPNRYPDPTARTLCEAFADYYRLDPAHVVCGNGADELLFVLLSAFCSKNDTVAITAPDFAMYKIYAQLCECNTAVLQKNDDFVLNAQTLSDFVHTQCAKVLLFSNPCNPTAQLMPADDVRALLRACPDTLVLLDEAYMDFANDDASLLREAHEYDNLIVLRTASKMSGLAAYRLGFAVAAKVLRDKIAAAKSPYNVNAFSQAAGSIVYRERAYLDDCRAQLRASVSALYAALCTFASDDFTVYPTSTNFVTIRTSRAAHLAATLSAFGVSVRRIGDLLRVTCGSAAENAALINALEEIVHA